MTQALCLLFALCAFFLSVHGQTNTTTAPPAIDPTTTTMRPTCGNTRCESWLGENCTGCPADCGACPSCDNICGNHRCEPLESGCNCPEDCGYCCINGRCEENENAINCPRDCTTDMVGFVDELMTLSPVANATVTCQSESSLRGETAPTVITTNARGYFRVANLTSGIYTCTATYPGYTTNSASIDFAAGLRPGPQPEYRISLIPLTGTLSGELRDSNFGGYLRNVNISCSRPINAPGGITESFSLRKSFETYYFGGLTAATYTCTAKKRGYTTVTQTATVSVGVHTNLPFYLTAVNGTVAGFVTENRCGQPLNGSLTCQSTVNFRTRGALTGTPSFTAAIVNGRFNTTTFPEVVYSCTTSVAGYAAYNFVVDCLRPAGTFLKNFSLTPLSNTPPLTLSVRTVDSRTGASLSGATLRLSAPGFPAYGSNISPVLLATKTTGNNGATWDLLPSTEGTVTATLNGYSPAYRRFSAQCYNNTIEIPLTPVR
eukprot:TRINITY_DN7379_c0_g1_i1.p1 TRINITY_DN7379_c0_g1~~TRINITY_DN7379_c0_g1_i1.p1  ORF type:complete len:515 (-),score=154.89 TRINITY_DN7379_c0_g1_i1:189-1655(-)